MFTRPRDKGVSRCVSGLRYAVVTRSFVRTVLTFICLPICVGDLGRYARRAQAGVVDVEISPDAAQMRLRDRSGIRREERLDCAAYRI